MEFLLIALVMAATFGICYLVDKGFAKIFRSTAQHSSGRAVRLNKKYGAFGAAFFALGVAAVFVGMNSKSMLLWICGILIVLVGIALVVYYLTFGVYYDDSTFLYSSFGKKSRVYRYEEIQTQQLYTSAGGILIELRLADGRSVNLQAAMEGVYPFLDCAFAGWCAQTGRDPEQCEFHDPANSCWFPPVEVQ